MLENEPCDDHHLKWRRTRSLQRRSCFLVHRQKYSTQALHTSIDACSSHALAVLNFPKSRWTHPKSGSAYQEEVRNRHPDHHPPLASRAASVRSLPSSFAHIGSCQAASSLSTGALQWIFHVSFTLSKQSPPRSASFGKKALSSQVHLSLIGRPGQFRDWSSSPRPERTFTRRRRSRRVSTSNFIDWCGGNIFAVVVYKKDAARVQAPRSAPLWLCSTHSTLWQKGFARCCSRLRQRQGGSGWPGLSEQGTLEG